MAGRKSVLMDDRITEIQMSPNMDMAADVLSAVRYARPFFNEETDLGKALTIVFDAATRYAGSFQQVPGVVVAAGPDYEAAAKWLQQRWESEAVQDGFPATPWDDLELEDRDWWLTQAQGVVAAALADSDALIIRRDQNGEWPEAVIGRLAGPSPNRRHRMRSVLDALASSQGVEP